MSYSYEKKKLFELSSIFVVFSNFGVRESVTVGSLRWIALLLLTSSSFPTLLSNKLIPRSIDTYHH